MQQANRGLGGVPSGPAHREIVLEREKRRRERLEGEDTPGGIRHRRVPYPCLGDALGRRRQPASIPARP